MSQEYIKIFSGTSIITTRLKSLLEEHYINSIIRDDQESARLAGFGAPINSVQLFVLASDVASATPIVNSFKEEIGR